jgi:hypothetical protein
MDADADADADAVGAFRSPGNNLDTSLSPNRHPRKANPLDKRRFIPSHQARQPAC